MSQPCPNCATTDCPTQYAYICDFSTEVANSMARDDRECRRRVAARAEQAESRAVEMMAQIGALVNRAEQAEFERDGLRAEIDRMRQQLSEVRSWADFNNHEPPASVYPDTAAFLAARRGCAVAILVILEGNPNV